MAKILLLLAVLAITAKGSAVGLEIIPNSSESWVKVLTMLREKTNHFSDSLERVINDQELPKAAAPETARWTVTDIKVDGKSLGGGSVILVTTVPFPFLNTEAYNLVMKKFPAAAPAGTFNLLCSATQLSPVTLVLVAQGTEETLERPWVEQSDGSKCLSIVQNPWA